METSKLREDVIDYYLHSMELEPGGELPVKVKRLSAHFKKNKGALAECSECGLASDVNCVVCPYCGVGDEDPDAEAKFKKSLADFGAGKGVTNGSAIVKVEPAPLAKVPPVAKKGLKKRTSATPKPTAAKVAVKAGKSVTVVSGGELKQLDEAVSEFKQLQLKGATSYWLMGQVVYRVYTKQLWRHRRDAEGNSLYSSWAKFVEAELQMSKAYAHKLMDTAQNFSEEDFGVVGVTRLDLVLRVSPPERIKLVEKIRKSNLSVTELKEQLRGKRKETGRTLPGGVNPNAHRAEAEPKLTLVVPDKRVKVKLYVRDKEGVRAKTLSADAQGEELSLNGVRTLYRLVKHDDGLMLVIERRRE